MSSKLEGPGRAAVGCKSSGAENALYMAPLCPGGAKCAGVKTRTTDHARDENSASLDLLAPVRILVF